MIAGDIMSQPVIGISPDAPLEQAIGLMIQSRFTGLPVIDNEGRVVGMLTEGDLLCRVETGTEGENHGWLARLFTPGRLAGEYILTHGRQVYQVMTHKVIGVEENTPLSDVVKLMQHHRVKRLPVLRDESVIGIVSRADIMRAVGEALGVRVVAPSDHLIRQTVLERLSCEPWAHRRSISVAVEKGVVVLDGSVFDMRARTAIGVLAENVPGIKRVENRIVCIEPNSGVVIYGPDSEISPHNEAHATK